MQPSSVVPCQSAQWRSLNPNQCRGWDTPIGGLGISLGGAVSALEHYGPFVLAAAAGAVCTVATSGVAAPVCEPLAVAAVAATIGAAAHEDGIIGGGKANYGRFSADVTLSLLFYGIGKAAIEASDPYYTPSHADQVALRGATHLMLVLAHYLYHGLLYGT